MQQNFINHGIPPDAALQSAYKSLDFMVYKQASVLSYMDVFLYLALMFLICIPFVLIVKEKKHKKEELAEAAAAAH